MRRPHRTTMHGVADNANCISPLPRAATPDAADGPVGRRGGRGGSNLGMTLRPEAAAARRTDIQQSALRPRCASYLSGAYCSEQHCALKRNRSGLSDKTPELGPEYEHSDHSISESLGVAWSGPRLKDRCYTTPRKPFLETLAARQNEALRASTRTRGDGCGNRGLACLAVGFTACSPRWSRACHHPPADARDSRWTSSRLPE